MFTGINSLHQKLQLKMYYVKQTFFCSLENSILKYKGKGNIVIMGDLNAQTRIEDHSHRQ